VSSIATFARCHATEQRAHWVPSYGSQTVHRGQAPRRPFFPTHTGHWAHTRSVGGEGLPRSNHRRVAPPPRTSHGGAAHTISGENRRAGQIRRASNHSHTQTPPRTLAALRSAGTVRHASRATARSTHTTKEARGWAIGGRHGQMCARICGLPHFPHDAQISDQNSTMLLSVRRFHIVLVFCIYIPNDRDAVLTG